MSKQIDALKLALEAMEDMLSGDLTPYQASKTITSIKKALAEQPAHVAAVNTSSERVDKTEENVHEKPAQQPVWPEHELRNAIGLMRQQDEQNGFGNFAVAIKALEGLLEAPQPAQQEPVAWMKDCADFWEHYTYISEVSQENYKAEAQMWVEKLRTSPQPIKPWVGLSTVELDEIDAPIRERGHATVAEIYRAIEAKLREKNA